MRMKRIDIIRKCRVSYTWIFKTMEKARIGGDFVNEYDIDTMIEISEKRVAILKAEKPKHWEKSLTTHSTFISDLKGIKNAPLP